jgi:hypothetical protein
MAAAKKPRPLEAFETNMADARHLVGLAEALTNTRARKMRRELRERVGDALKIPARLRSELDCLQSSHLFVTFLPGSGIKRSDFDDARPLLRQALVAACAATETYLADRTMELIGRKIYATKATKNLRAVALTVDDWLWIDAYYERKRVGLRNRVIEPYVRQQASTSPSKVGHLLSMIEVTDWAKQVDATRGATKGDTVANLERITTRRNRIAHEGDRSGRGRASLTVAEVRADLDCLESIVTAIEAVSAA